MILNDAGIEGSAGGGLASGWWLGSFNVTLGARHFFSLESSAVL
jgi:hypothetical protein